MINKKIILTGYRATGKTSVGKNLARHLGFVFLDTDALIVEQTGQTIKEIVAQRGWAYFRTLEKDLLESLIERTGIVIATGGGAITHREVWHRLMDSGLTVWLTADPHTIRQRLAQDENSAAQRPALTDHTVDDEIKTVLQEREPLYRLGSHLAIDTGSLDINKIVEIIEKNLSP